MDGVSEVRIADTDEVIGHALSEAKGGRLVCYLVLRPELLHLLGVDEDN